MPSPSSFRSSSVRDILLERFDALLGECDLVMATAEYGRTFHDLDDFFCTKGHELLQEVFQQKLQERITASEKTAESKQCSGCKKKRPTKTRKRNR
jgi:chromosome condensin MukBEF complex kleisin-like MukF subunit